MERRPAAYHGRSVGEEMGVCSSLLVFGFLIAPFFFLSGAQFTPATSVLLNCGSGVSARAPDDTRPFLADSPSDSVALPSSSDSTQLADPSPSSSTSPLYRTARVFTGRSSYEFTVTAPGAHVLRLHFFPFVTRDYDLSSAVFSVTALDGVRMLSDFSAKRDDVRPVVKEYFLWIDSTKLNLAFEPSGGGSSRPLAFVSAVEVFTAPTELISKSERFQGLSPDLVLETVYRINVGGPLIVPSNDTLWRTWNTDDLHLFGNATSVKVNTTESVPYSRGGSTREIAPDRVYSTAREMSTNSLQDPRFNITWQFNVSAAGSHLVRMHFYDFVSKAAADLYFNAYVDDQEVYADLHPVSFTFNSFSVPFYWDSVMDDGGRGGWRILRVSVGRSAKSAPSKVNAILNGLEIMKIVLSEGGKSETKKKKTMLVYILVPSVLGGLVLLGSLIVCCRLASRRRRKPAPERKGSGTSWFPVGVGQSVTIPSPRTPGPAINLGLQISFEDIRFATNNFDDGLVIGKGGFGSVYKGVLRDGKVVAVKRGVAGGPSHQGYPEFQTEVTVLSKIRHRHLVSLIGYCDEGEEMILVYEFMEKGPLKHLLYGWEDAAAACLSWKQRLEICIGAARGIHYLHTGYSQVIIHRDLKSSNILLGEDYVAKVSDFGLSRLGPSVGETHVSTAVKGSFGYLDPEYFKTQQLTDKSDVYSFGVVLFEVLCARPVLDPLLSREQLNLAEWATFEHQRGRLDTIVDPRLKGSINSNSLRKFGETAVKCLAEYGADRPAIGDVLWNLEYCLQLQQSELRREPHDDSGVVPVPVPVPVPTRPLPSTNARAEESGDAEVDDDRIETTTSNVFSQLITHEGR